MDKTPIHVDEFGTIRFTVYPEDGTSYEFEQEAESDLLFVTIRDGFGRATTKRVIDTRQKENQEIVKVYETYIKESEE